MDMATMYRDVDGAQNPDTDPIVVKVAVDHVHIVRTIANQDGLVEAAPRLETAQDDVPDASLQVERGEAGGRVRAFQSRTGMAFEYDRTARLSGSREDDRFPIGSRMDQYRISPHHLICGMLNRSPRLGLASDGCIISDGIDVIGRRQSRARAQDADQDE
jgi:hypothetical protein